MKICEYCFNDEESFVNYYFNNKYDNNNTIVACEDKDIVSSLRLNQYKIKLDGKEYETSYVVGVSTFPQVRGRGYMKKIMEYSLNELYKRNQLVSILMPIDYRLYRKYGYEHCYDQLEYSINIEDLKNFNLLGRLYKASEKHIDDLIDINNLFLSDVNGNTVRDKEYYINLLSNIEKDNLKKAFIRGSFLGSGSINDPKKKYHIEISLENKEYANILKNILNEFNIIFKELERKSSYSLYSKDGEEISKFLALIGASKAVINFEEIRVIRDIRNNVNRKVNCETANLNKTVNAAVRQIDDIKFIYNSKAEDKLSDSLKEIANLRMENPDISLVELGKLLKEPIGKSGVNHRLKKIQEIANELRGNK